MQVEVNASKVKDPSDGLPRGFMVTPPIGEDYWLARVNVGGGQFVVAFPKLSTIGIGFAQEDDWNTNRPFLCSADEIYAHIKHNRGAATATQEDCIQAIEMLRKWAEAWKPPLVLWP